MSIPTSPAPASGERRYDLDALRAFAKGLGIFYHAALSLALGFPWFTQDPAANRSLFLFISAVHGFRMPLFFVVSGFFTAMLWRSRGLKALLGHRFRRVLLPCLTGLFTLVPITNWVMGYAIQSSITRANRSFSDEMDKESIWGAVRKFDSDRVREYLRDGFDSQSLHPQYRPSPTCSP